MADGSEDVLRAVASRLLRDRDRVIDELSAVMRAQVEALDLDTRMRGMFEAGTTDNLLAAIDFVQRGSAASAVRAPARALVYARTLAQRDVPLSALIRAYRIGHAGFLDVAMRYVVELGGPDSAEAIIRLVNRTAVYIDQVCEQVSVAYEEERDRWVGSRGGLRQEWVGRVLDGSVTDIGRAEQVLGYCLTGSHIAMNVWTEADVSPRDALEVLDRVRGALISLLGNARPLLVPVDEREARLWFPVSAIDAAAVGRTLAAMTPRVRMAIGEHGRGVTGFRHSLRRADQVREIMLIGGVASPPVVSYAQVAAVALLTGDLVTLREYVADCLGGLALDTERNLWLRETLRVFLANNRSFAGASQELSLHRNTVQYRVQQALGVIGHDLGDHDRALHLHLALQAARWLGSAVLVPAA